MNIYDEAIENAKECYGMVKTNMTQQQVWDYEHKNIETQRFIVRAKKVEELLGLYRNLSMETDVFERSKYWEQINKIELEEMK
jgi:hypothetical protein